LILKILYVPVATVMLLALLYVVLIQENYLWGIVLSLPYGIMIVSTFFAHKKHKGSRSKIATFFAWLPIIVAILIILFNIGLRPLFTRIKVHNVMQQSEVFDCGEGRFVIVSETLYPNRTTKPTPPQASEGVYFIDDISKVRMKMYDPKNKKYELDFLLRPIGHIVDDIYVKNQDYEKIDSCANENGKLFKEVYII